MLFESCCRIRGYGIEVGASLNTGGWGHREHLSTPVCLFAAGLFNVVNAGFLCAGVFDRDRLLEGQGIFK